MNWHADNQKWGAGSRECIGKHIALLEIYRAVEFLILRYDLNISEKNIIWENFQFTPYSKMMASVKIRPRKDPQR